MNNLDTRWQVQQGPPNIPDFSKFSCLDPTQASVWISMQENLINDRRRNPLD